MKHLEKLAKDAGITVVASSPKNGEGKFGYKDAEYPQCTTVGFMKESTALKHGLEDKYGKTGLKAILKLFKKIDQLTAPTPLPNPDIIVTDAGGAWDFEANAGKVAGTLYYTGEQMLKYRKMKAKL